MKICLIDFSLSFDFWAMSIPFRISFQISKNDSSKGIIFISLDGFSNRYWFVTLSHKLSESRLYDIQRLHMKTWLIQHCKKLERMFFQRLKKNFWWNYPRWKSTNHEPDDTIDIVLEALIVIGRIDFFENFGNKFNILK